MDYYNSTLMAPARTQELGVEMGRELSDLQLLAKLQHLRAATGLLDFSWNPLVGLWFACEEPDVEGKLFVINVNDPIQVAMISKDEVEQPVSSLFLPKGESPSMTYWEPTASSQHSYARVPGRARVSNCRARSARVCSWRGVSSGRRPNWHWCGLPGCQHGPGVLRLHHW